MGCTQSKIENEEAVMRCKDRKQFMREAVIGRNAFAAAHAGYAMAIKNTGAALSDYTHGEVQNAQQITNTPHSSTAAAATATASSQPPLDPLFPPPPPPPSVETSQAPIQRAASMPEMKITRTREQINGVGPSIAEEDDNLEDEIESNETLITRKRSKGRNKSGDRQTEEAPVTSPERRPLPAVENSGSIQAMQEWDYWFPLVESAPGPSLEVKDEKENVELKGFDELPEREEKVKKTLKEVHPPPPPPPEVADMEVEKVVAATSGGSVGRNMKRGKSGAGAGEKRVAKGGMSLLQVFVELDDHFLKASESAHEVSKMLEATRLHYHSNFADNRGNCQVLIKY